MYRGYNPYKVNHKTKLVSYPSQTHNNYYNITFSFNKTTALLLLHRFQLHRQPRPQHTDGKEGPVDFFRLFFTPEVVDIIYIQSSLYAEQQHHTHKDYLDHHPHARAHDWVRNPLKRSEIEPLLAILLTMGVLGFLTLRLGSLKYNVPQHKINNYTITMFRSYWSTKWPFGNTIFSNIMSGR